MSSRGRPTVAELLLGASVPTLRGWGPRSDTIELPKGSRDVVFLVLGRNPLADERKLRKMHKHGEVFTYVINDDRVSRDHACIEIRKKKGKPEVFIYDMDSSNGVAIGEIDPDDKSIDDDELEVLEPRDRVPLKNYSVIFLGNPKAVAARIRDVPCFVVQGL